MIRKAKKTFKCDVCEMAFSYVGNLKDHKRTQTGERPYRCNVCDHESSYSSHSDSRFIQRQKPYKCDVCVKAFTQIIWRNIREHIQGRNHSNAESVIKHLLNQVIWKDTWEGGGAKFFSKFVKHSFFMFCEYFGHFWFFGQRGGENFPTRHGGANIFRPSNILDSLGKIKGRMKKSFAQIEIRWFAGVIKIFGTNRPPLLRFPL